MAGEKMIAMSWRGPMLRDALDGLPPPWRRIVERFKPAGFW